jgi:ribosomal-protein-alanine N-acetyltransferase
MRQEDLGAVYEIERETPSPWSLVSLEQELQVRRGRQFVAESSDRQILGWCACRLLWPEAELLKIAVTTGERKKGVGTSLLQHVIGELQGQSYSGLFLEVRANNKPALSFYERHGFLRVGIRSHYYSDPVDDALILKRDLVP